MQWIRATEKKPAHKMDTPLKIDGIYYMGWYNKSKNLWLTDSNNEFHNDDVLWLDESETPSQPFSREQMEQLWDAAHRWALFPKTHPDRETYLSSLPKPKDAAGLVEALEKMERQYINAAACAERRFNEQSAMKESKHPDYDCCELREAKVLKTVWATMRDQISEALQTYNNQ